MKKEVYRGMLKALLIIADNCEGSEYERETREVLEDARRIIKRDKKQSSGYMFDYQPNCRYTGEG